MEIILFRDRLVWKIKGYTKSDDGLVTRGKIFTTLHLYLVILTSERPA